MIAPLNMMLLQGWSRLRRWQFSGNQLLQICSSIKKSLLISHVSIWFYTSNDPLSACIRSLTRPYPKNSSRDFSENSIPQLLVISAQTGSWTLKVFSTGNDNRKLIFVYLVMGWNHLGISDWPVFIPLPQNLTHWLLRTSP